MPRTAARSSPARAPEPLALVQDLLNSLHVERGTDELGDQASATAWLDAVGYRLPGDIARSDLKQLRALRTAVRRLVTAHAPGKEGELRRAAAESLTVLAGIATYVPEVGTDGALRFRAVSDGVTAVIGRVVVAMHQSQQNGTWERLKICRNDTCAWAFYDQSRNHSGTWCAMGICGNRTKAARHRARQRRAVHSAPL
ncbi:MAG: CGNR zinc finger domain-containing protein [Dermatophilaceae bacterium]